MLSAEERNELAELNIRCNRLSEDKQAEVHRRMRLWEQASPSPRHACAWLAAFRAAIDLVEAGQ